jgi:hypothetical protein
LWTPPPAAIIKTPLRIGEFHPPRCHASPV